MNSANNLNRMDFGTILNPHDTLSHLFFPKWWHGKSFHQFKLLAPEIQATVWQFAIPDPRDVDAATVFYLNYDLDHPKAILHPPAYVKRHFQDTYESLLEKKDIDPWNREDIEDYSDFEYWMAETIAPRARDDNDNNDDQYLDILIPDHEWISYQVRGRILPLMHTCRVVRAAVLDIYYLRPSFSQTKYNYMDLRLCSPTLPKPNRTIEKTMMHNRQGRCIRWAAEDVLYVPPQMDVERSLMMYELMMGFGGFRVFDRIKKIALFYGSGFLTAASMEHILGFLGNFGHLEEITMYFDPGKVANKTTGALVLYEPLDAPLISKKVWYYHPRPSEISLRVKQNFREVLARGVESGAVEEDPTSPGSPLDWRLDPAERADLSFECAVLCWKKPRHRKER